MGDRANIVVRQDEGDVVLYTHWNGDILADIVHAALSKKWRWQDDAYLARVIFCELVKGSEQNETGFGISTGLCDNEHPLIVVDVGQQRVYLYDEEDKLPPRDFVPSKSASFEDFVAAPASALGYR